MTFIQTVLGPIQPEAFGFALAHEHILCDFIGAEQTHFGRWNRDEVIAAMKPRLLRARERGVTGFVDCTPAFIGRDVELLRRLADAADLHILTNTGYYGAARDKFVPRHAFDETAEQLADRWTREWENGIDGTGIKPGFIKIGVDPGQLSPMDRKLVRAAALTHHRTGLAIASHTANGIAALETIDVLSEEDVPASKYICVHTDSEKETTYHRQIADRDAWVEYDGIGWRPIDEHLALVQPMIEKHTARLLLSQDSGWWHVGEPNGGNIRDYTHLTDDFLPRLRAAGVGQALVRKVMIENPSRAFAVN